METGDRKVYFQLEARKVMDILNEEIVRLGRSQSIPMLVEDLYESWSALWGRDDHPPVKNFTGMFEMACTILACVGRLERKPTLQEQELLDTLFQAMSRLVSGQEGENFLI